MKSSRIKEAVILAAGNGRRMIDSSLPKPLVNVGSHCLLEHVLKRAAAAGIEKVAVVIGYRGDEIRQRIQTNGHIEVEWVENPRYDLPNGVSLLAAADRINSSFLLLMADHLFETEILRSFLENALPASGGVLATDSKISQVFDLQDATKVKRNGNRIGSIGKNLDGFDLVDTGMFLLSPEIFPVMKESVEGGAHSLSDGIALLSKLHGVDVWDIGHRRWIDVDTPEARQEAERMLECGELD